jgi:hypothetical protein
MKLKIELEVEVTGDCSFKEAENFFLYAFAGYSLSDWENNPLINEESDTEYDVTDIKIEEV